MHMVTRCGWSVCRLEAMPELAAAAAALAKSVAMGLLCFNAGSHDNEATATSSDIAVVFIMCLKFDF